MNNRTTWCCSLANVISVNCKTSKTFDMVVFLCLLIKSAQLAMWKSKVMATFREKSSYKSSQWMLAEKNSTKVKAETLSPIPNLSVLFFPLLWTEDTVSNCEDLVSVRLKFYVKELQFIANIILSKLCYDSLQRTHNTNGCRNKTLNNTGVNRDS